MGTGQETTARTIMEPPSGAAVRARRQAGFAARRLLGRHHAAIALVLYLAVACVLQQHAVAHISSACACNGSDWTQFTWSLAWWPHALLHGENPFVTHAIWATHAVDVAAQTTTPGPALIAAPLTALAGPLVSYNVLMLIAPITGAWFAYRLCLYLTHSPAASILGGYLYGFSTYGMGQLEGHMQLVFTFAAPAVTLLTLKRLDGAIGARRYLVLMTVTLIAQVLCGMEMFLTLTCMGVVALIAGWIFSAAERRRRIIAVLAPLAGAYAVTVVVCSPYLYYVVTGPAIAVGRGMSFPADALSFVIPTAITRVGGHRFVAVSNAFAGDLAENGSYVGLPVIIMVFAFMMQGWRTRAVKVLLSVLAVAVLWSLGDTLTIDGHPTISLPWKALQGLPGLNEVLPVRICVYIFLVCAVIVALWVAAPGSSRWRRWLLAALGVVFLIPNVNAQFPGSSTYLFQEQAAGPTFFTTDLYRHYLRPNEIVLPFPYGPIGPSLLWQAYTNMYFRLASGDFYVPLDYWADPFVQEAIGNLPFTAPVAQLRSFIAQHHVSAIVVEADDAGPWPDVIARLGLSEVRVGGVLLFRVPSGLSRAGRLMRLE